MLLATGRLGDVIGTQTLIILQAPNVLLRHKPSPEQAMGMQGGLPLAVFHVRLATGQVFNLPLPLIITTCSPAFSNTSYGQSQ